MEKYFQYLITYYTNNKVPSYEDEYLQFFNTMSSIKKNLLEKRKDIYPALKLKLDSKLAFCVAKGDVDGIHKLLRLGAYPCITRGDIDLLTLTCYRGDEWMKKFLLVTSHMINDHHFLAQQVSPSNNFLLATQYYVQLKENSMVCAARNNDMKIVKWLHKNRNKKQLNFYSSTYYAMDYASKNNNLEMIKWLHHNRNEGCTTRAIDVAALNGHLEVIKWLHTHRNEGYTPDAIYGAIESENIELIEWFHNQKRPFPQYTLEYAVDKGNLEVVKWIYKNCSDVQIGNAMNWASANGDLEIVKWLYYNRNDVCINQAIDQARENNHPEVVEWLLLIKK